MSLRSLGIPGIVFLAVLVALASPGHHPPARPGDVTQLNVTIHEWAVPTKSAHPHDPAVGPDGSLWFTEQSGNKIGRLDPKTGKMTLKEVPTESALPYGIQINSKGIPIFCELGTHKMASIDPKT